ncbi:MAG TPA: hypothetical protein VD837_04245 [Terriglobales bacterium]|nr:hypothetical protein [Terriglobales bacterium]
MKTSLVVTIASVILFAVWVARGQSPPRDPERIEPEAYRVYSEVLRSESERLASNEALVIKDITSDGQLKLPSFDLGKCFNPEQVPTAVVENFKIANARSWQLENRLEHDTYKFEHDVPHNYLQFSAVGFNPDKTLAVVELIRSSAPEDSTTIEQTSDFVLLGKQRGKWQVLKTGCHTSRVILSNVPSGLQQTH